MESSQGQAIMAGGLIAVLAGVLLALMPAGDNRAQAQGGGIDSACPSRGTPDAEALDPLEGPSADDELEENPRVLAETQVPEAPASNPNQGLRPILRPTGEAPVSAPAAADALTPAVELTLRWCVVQPVEGSAIQWGRYDSAFTAYRSRGIRIRTVRVTDAPDWAVTSRCVELAQAEDVKMCPPTDGFEEELETFAQAAAARFGPAGDYDVERLAFWNEPNLPKNWGVPQKDWSTEQGEREAAHRYSDLLAEFHAGATAGDTAIKVDAGEIAAGSTQEKGNGVRPWAQKFTNYTHNQGRDDTYNVLTIHPYSEVATQIPRKVASYKALPGVAAVGVTEVAWGVSNANLFKCVRTEQDQRAKFNNTVDSIRGSSVGVHRFAWFSVIDNPKSAGSKCPDNSGHYQPAVRNQMNTYGLSKRRPDGRIDSFSEATHRLLRVAFRNAQ